MKLISLLFCGLVQQLLGISPFNEILAILISTEKYQVWALNPGLQLQEQLAPSVGFLTYPRSEESMFLSFAVFLLLAVVAGVFPLLKLL